MLLDAATSIPTSEHKVPDHNWEVWGVFFCDVATEVLNIIWSVLNFFKEVKVAGSL